QSMNLFWRSARFRRMPGRISIAKLGLYGQSRSWCFMTCCETLLASRWKTSYYVKSCTDMVTMSFGRLRPEIGKHRILMIELPSCALFTTTRAQIRTVDRRSGANGSLPVRCDCVVFLKRGSAAPPRERKTAAVATTIQFYCCCVKAKQAESAT